MKTDVSALLLLIIGIGCGIGCAHTEAAAPGGTVETGTDAMDLATELAKLEVPEGSYQLEIANALRAGLGAASASAGEGALKGLKGVSPEVVLQLMLDVLPAKLIIETKAHLYAKLYSVPELRELLAFYRSDVGRKSVAILPQLAGEEATVFLQRFKDELPAATLRMARREVKDPSASPSLLDWAARTLATSKEATPDDLLAAKAAAEKAVASEPERSGFVDTLATAEFRLGDFDRAVEHESSVFAVRQDDRVVASQLARFEWARLNKNGLKIDGGDVETSGIRVEPTLPDAGSFGPSHFLLTVGQALPKGGQIDAIFVSDGKPIGIVRFNLGPDHPPSKTFYMTISPGTRVLPELKKDGLPADTKLVLSRVNTGWAAKPGVIQWRGKWMDAAVARLP